MSDYSEVRYSRRAASEWDFWIWAVKIGLPLGGLGVLFFLARQGDMVAIVMLAAIGAIMLFGLGIIAVLAVLDRLHKAEQMRFGQNMKENFMLMERMARAQNQQAKALLDENRELRRLARPAEEVAGGLDLDWDWDGLE